MKMGLVKFSFMLGLFLLSGCNFIVNISDEKVVKRIQAYKKGFNFVSWKRTEYGADYAKNSLDTMMTTGANWISIVVTLYQKSLSDTAMFEDLSKTPSVYSISRIVSYAHSKNLGVMLKIHVDIYDDTPRSRIKPFDLSAWFRNYSKYVLNYASVCQMLGVEMLCIGSELAELSGEKDSWVDLINKVREVYNGKLIYASNFDEYRKVSFWDELDYIGIDFFAPVSNKHDPVYDEIVLGWQPYLNDLKEWFNQDHKGKKLIFTEIGYPSTDGAGMQPWKIGDKVDLEEQRLCYDVALDVISNIEFVDGVFIWNWNVDLNADSLRKDYTPYGKPAIISLREKWSKEAI